MEADWSVEMGADLPSIVVPWIDHASSLKFIDLRAQPDLLKQIPEARQYPALGAALAVLNGSESHVFTAKCDAWRVAEDDLDSFDQDVARSEAQCGVVAYIDVLLREGVEFASFDLHENWLRRLTAELRALSLPGARVEFTLRWAQVEEHEGFATTVHVTGFGIDEASALRRWEAALAAIADLLARGATTPDVKAQALPAQDTSAQDTSAQSSVTKGSNGKIGRGASSSIG